MRTWLLNLITAGLLLVSVSCPAGEQPAVLTSGPSPTPVPPRQPADISWPSNPTEVIADRNVGLKPAWDAFERSQQYRLAQPSDRRLTPAAVERVTSNSLGQVVPFLTWWGVEGWGDREGRDVLIAIVVDPARTDHNRYGLVVFAPPTSKKGTYKVHWVAREEDMESYLLSPASGSVYVECFRRDGSQETKELIWSEASKRFRLR